MKFGESLINSLSADAVSLGDGVGGFVSRASCDEVSANGWVFAVEG